MNDRKRPRKVKRWPWLTLAYLVAIAVLLALPDDIAGGVVPLSNNELRGPSIDAALGLVDEVLRVSGIVLAGLGLLAMRDGVVLRMRALERALFGLTALGAVMGVSIMFTARFRIAEMLNAGAFDLMSPQVLGPLQRGYYAVLFAVITLGLWFTLRIENAANGEDETP